MRLPPVVLAHAQDLDHTDEDVDEVQLKADTLVDDILANQASLSHASVVEDLLDIIEGETTEDSETTVQPDLLGPHQSAGGSSGEDKRSETGESDNGHTSEQRSTKVHVLLLLSSGTDESNGTHHSSGVKTSASKNSRVHEHQGRQERGLGDVESGPETILLDVASDLSEKDYIGKRMRWRRTYLSGFVYRVPYMVPTLATRPRPITAQGLAAIKR